MAGQRRGPEAAGALPELELELEAATGELPLRGQRSAPCLRAPLHRRALLGSRKEQVQELARAG